MMNGPDIKGNPLEYKENPLDLKGNPLEYKENFNALRLMPPSLE